MQLFVAFEHWHLGDGNYPAFAVGDEARLSFELQVVDVEVVSEATEDRITPLRDAEYEIVGRVIRRYAEFDTSPFPVVEAAWLRFYCPSRIASRLAVGSKVRLRGTLALDRYQWVEFLEQYPNPPDLFYGVRVTRVREVQIGDEFIQRSAHGVGSPTRLGPHDYTAADVREVSTVGGGSGEPAFSILDLAILPSGSGPPRPTFFER